MLFCFQRFVGGSVDLVVGGLGGAGGLALGDLGVRGAVLFVFNGLWEGALILWLLVFGGVRLTLGALGFGSCGVLFSAVCGRVR